MNLNDYAGLIELDTDEAKELGFTSDKFSNGSYLWKLKNDIWVSFIESIYPNKGNLSKLFNRIHELGYTIKVPIPLNRMKLILKEKGFKKIIERNNEADEDVNVWVKEPSK